MKPHNSLWQRLSPVTRTAILLCLSQALTLALGLWIRERFLTSMLEALRESGHALDTTTTAILNVMTYLWICGMQGAPAWMILHHGHKSESDKIRGQREDSLTTARELVRTRDAVIFGLAKLSESRDPETGRHLERISLYSTKLASALRSYPEYRKIITPTFIRTIGVSSVLHDIGKVGVSDAVLLKRGKLTPAEREHIESHARIGADCLHDIERQLGDSEFLRMAKEIALSHHEWWDGTGYPQGLEGEQIPLAARIVAIADVYDALSTHRSYKEAFPHQECVDHIREGAGTHFDPGLVNVFLQIEGDFRLIARRFAANSDHRDRLTRTEEEILSSILDQHAPEHVSIESAAG
ncbi:MAG: HD domain-containing protein [Planctomycetaceae bacterium]|nr:HD domain-containing protein [Planctomycetaceae bacterium]